MAQTSLFVCIPFAVYSTNKVVCICSIRCIWHKQGCLYVFHPLYIAQTRLFVCIPSAVYGTNKVVCMYSIRCIGYKQGCLYVLHPLYRVQTRLFVYVPSAVYSTNKVVCMYCSRCLIRSYVYGICIKAYWFRFQKMKNMYILIVPYCSICEN